MKHRAPGALGGIGLVGAIVVRRSENQLKDLLTMFYYVSKALTELVYPFNLALVSLLAGLWCLYKGKTRCTAGAIIFGLVLLVVPGTGAVGDWLLAPLESHYPVRLTEDYPKSDAIVVLGGTTYPIKPPRLEAEEMGGCRLLQAARLYHAGKAKTVILTGGSWYDLPDGSVRTEAEDMRDILLAYQIPKTALVLETASRNTDENAELTLALTKPDQVRKILLVSSAFHLRRAVPLFQHRGFEVTAVPTSFSVGREAWSFRHFAPTASGIVRSSTAIKEYLGHFAYTVLGKN